MTGPAWGPRSLSGDVHTMKSNSVQVYTDLIFAKHGVAPLLNNNIENIIVFHCDAIAL